MIAIVEARSILGHEADGLSDREVEQIVRELRALVDIALDVEARQRDSEVSLDTPAKGA